MMIDEGKLLDFLKSEYSWEQIIYEVIAWEGLDPWDLDLVRLSEGFTKYMGTMKELDFRVPAKYVIVASTLLKMKSDYIRAFKEQVTGEEEQKLQEQLRLDQPIEEGFVIDPLNIPPRREPTRRVVVAELIEALKRVMRTNDRKAFLAETLRKRIDTSSENLNDRIKELYGRINTLLFRIKKKEIEFSKLVDTTDREDVVSTFIPLIHLDNQGKVEAKQEEVFQEIMISRRDNKPEKKTE